MALFTDDQGTETLFNSGEGIDPADFNTLQRILRRKRDDGIFADRYWRPGQGGSDRLRVMDSALRFTANSLDRDILVNNGTVLFTLDPDPGAPEPQFLLHTLEAGITIPVDANALGFERWDIITAKVENLAADNQVRDFEDAVTRAKTTAAQDKTRFTRLTLNYIVGTVVTTEPAVPAGEVKIARIEVPNGAALLTPANVADYRKPTGFRRFSVPLTTWWSPSWTFNQIGEQPSWGGSADEVNVPLWASHMQANQNLGHANANWRLAELHVVYQRPGASAGFTYEVKAIDQGSFLGAPAPAGVDVSAAFGATGVFARAFVDMDSFDPLWLSGQRNPRDPGTLVDPAIIFQHEFGSGGSHDLVNVVAGWWGL